MKFSNPFNKISKKDTSIAGGKGANLGEMAKAKIPVPPGFVVLISAFDKFFKETDIQKEIEAMWSKINFKDIKSVKENSKIIRDLILKGKMPEEIEKEILEAYQSLNKQKCHSELVSESVCLVKKKNKKILKQVQDDIIEVQNNRTEKNQDDNFENFVAVRSSATAEDSKIDSWAGELESYLNTTKENLIENIKKCWASLYAPRALFYRTKRGLTKNTPLTPLPEKTGHGKRGIRKF